MKTDNRTKRTGRLVFTGFSMGLADLVPGVSGGTIALLYGIYDELIYSIKFVTGPVLGLGVKGRFRQAWRQIPFEFLLPVFGGIAFAIISLVSVITYLLDNHPIFIWSLFFGLIVGSALIISRRLKAWTIQRVLLLIAGFTLIFWVTGLSSGQASASPLAFLATGAVAICAMILPGISGSLIMVILGQYENVIHAISDREVVNLLFFATGAIVGLALFARLLSWLLSRYHGAMIAFLTGMMLGSLRKVWPWQEQVSDTVSRTVWPPLDLTLITAVVLMVVGFVLVWQLEKRGVAKEHHHDIAGKTIT